MYIEFVKDGKYAGKFDPDDPHISDNLDGYEDAGYIIQDDEVVVDIDDLSKEQIRQLLKIFNIKTQTEWTDRGVHLYFKDRPKSLKKHEGDTPLGFHCEVFYRKRNENYTAICCKRNGIARPVDNPGVRESFPDIFSFGNYKNLQGLSEGEERNNALYAHKKRIRKFDNWQKILRFINEVLFDEPLSEDEFTILSRDEGYTGESDQEYDVATYLIRELGAVVYCDRLFVRDGDYNYISREREIQNLVYQYTPGKKVRFVDEVIEQMRIRAREIDPKTEFKVKFKNGYLFQGKFYETEYTGFTPYVIDVEYDPEAEPVKEVDDYLDLLSGGDKAYRDRIIEIISHCFVTNKYFKRHLAKFHVIRGDGGNGKGTFLQVIQKILGLQNCSALSLSNMQDERYAYNMVGKLANLGDDLSGKPINDEQMKILKNLTTCDPISVRKMRENAVTEEFIITLIFTSNHNIKSFEKSEAYKRRVDWLPIFGKPKKADPDFISKITTKKALRYWIRLAIEGYQRLYKNKCFTPTPIVDAYNEQYHEENDNTIVFVRDLSPSQIVGKRQPEIYNIYEQWCLDNGDEPLSKKALRETIQREHGLILGSQRSTVTKKVMRVYKYSKDINSV